MPVPAVSAAAAPSRNPRASTPTTTSASPTSAANATATAVKASPSARTGVMSRNTTPGAGKSGTGRTRADTLASGSLSGSL